MSDVGTVLVIDDEEAFRETYRDLLEAEGYAVVAIASAAEARRLLETRAFDVVLLDQKLRRAGGPSEGLDLLPELVASGAKVIVATGFASSEFIERAFADGAFDYLEKSEHLKTFLRVKVRNAMEATRSRLLASLANGGKTARLQQELAAVRSEMDGHRKGRRLEALVAALLGDIPGFTVTEQNARLADEEIDIVVRNESTDPFWSHEGQYVIVECKNWSGVVGRAELDVLRAKVERRAGRSKLGLMVSVNGFTEGVRSAQLATREKGVLIVLIDGAGLERLVDGPDRGAVLKELHGRAVLPE